jgi:hypothetical protein
MMQTAINLGRTISEGLAQKVGQQSSGAERDSEGALPRATTSENKSQFNMNIDTLKIRSLFVVAVFALFVGAVYALTLARQGMPAGPLPLVLAALVLYSLAARPMLREEAHIAASVFCVLHAALISYSLMHTVGTNTDNFGGAFLYYTLVFAWPVWLIVLPISWSFTSRNWWKLLVPLGLGALALLPALADLQVVFAFLIHGPGL